MSVMMIETIDIGLVINGFLVVALPCKDFSFA